MHQLKKYFAVLSIATIAMTAHAATPSEKLSSTVTRSAASGAQITDSLVKNIFRQDSVQVPYAVQEAYQDTETYYENVPYQDTETYYEDVPYQDQENYQDTETYTDYENRCEDRVQDERVCHDIEDCHIAPGVGPGGGPNRICTTQPVCENVPRHYQECNNVPVQKTRVVTKTRWVTKYRQEQRTRTVTKYRQEQRTRTVTKYRDKQVCCRTETKNTFDHQFTLPVVINFPAETVLTGSEQETFALQFSGTEAAPVVTLTPKSTLFGYAVDHQELHGGSMVIDLKRVALYTADQLGQSSIKSLSLRVVKAGAEIRFNDQGLRARVTSAYSYQIHEVGVADILAQGSQAAADAQAVIPVQVTLEEGKAYQVDVRVVRQGLPLAADIDVTVSATQKVSSLKDVSVYTNQAMVNTFELRGEKDQARLFFRDQSPTDEGVSTTYKIEILAGDKNGQVLATKELAREAMTVTSKAFFLEQLDSDLGISSQVLNNQVRDGKLITTRVTVTREHAGLNEGAPVVFVLIHTAHIHKE